MRDVIVLIILIASAPICLISPYFGVLMWFWVTYFNPHRFTWGYAYTFPAALIVAVPTLIGTVIGKKTLRSLLTAESLLLMVLWVWFAITYVHAQGTPLFSGNMADAQYEMSHISKILLMTFVMVVIINSKERLRSVLLVTGGSLGLLALKSSLFGFRTGGESRVYGPPDSFLSENNAYGLALNMALPLLFFLVRDEPRKLIRVAFRVFFVASIVSVLLTYSRGGLLGLAAVNFLGFLAHEVYATVFVLYVIYRYGWNQRTIGISLAVVGIASMIIMAAVIGPVVKRFGERRALFAGLLLGALGFALFGWAPVGWLFMLAIPINCLWALAGPPSQSMMTQRVSASEQGQLQGAIGSVRSVAMIVGPSIFSMTFAFFIAPGRPLHLPGAPWYLAALLLIAALAVAFAVAPKTAPARNRESEVAEAQAV